MAGPNKRMPRQKVVNQATVTALMGDPSDDNGGGIVAQLAREQAGTDQTLERKNPRRPAEDRRKQRRFHITFSVGNEDVVDRLRDLARQWDMFALNGLPNVSGVLEYLLLPQLEAAEQGKIESPGQPLDDLRSDKKPDNVWF